MKKLLALLLSLLLALSMTSAFAVEAVPFVADKTVDTSTNIYVSAYYGLTKMDIDVDGVTRTMCVYVPQSYFPCCDMLLVMAPDGKTAEEFANESGWMEISEKYGFGVAFFEGKDLKWNLEDPAGDLAFYQTAVNVFGNREVIDFGEASLYMIGYGEGASIAHIISLSYSSMLAGVVTMGGSDVSAEYIEKVGNEQSMVFSINVDFETRLDGYFNKDVVMPIWIINDGDANEALIEYWKSANDVVEEGLKNEYGDVFIQDELFIDGTVNNKALSRVWVSEMDGAAEYFDAEFEEYVWNNFFTERRRFSSEPNGALRVGYTLEEIGMIERSVEIDGYTRYWLVYVPSSYDGTAEVPLVVANHGHAARAEVYAQHSEWWRVAEARGFIVAFPQGSRCTSHPLCGCTQWATSGEGLEDELEYINIVLDDLKGNYKIDNERIYVTGHSNGGQFTGLLACNMPEVFAAAANVGGTAFLQEKADERNLLMPYIGIVGEYDLMGMGNYGDPECASTIYMEERLRINGLAETEPYVKDTNAYVQYTYNTEAGIPLTEVMVNENFHHSSVPQYAWLVWDEFFSNYSRDAEGISYFCGTPIG